MLSNGFFFLNPEGDEKLTLLSSSFLLQRFLQVFDENTFLNPIFSILFRTIVNKQVVVFTEVVQFNSAPLMAWKNTAEN